jgi:hypothetical protein
VGPFSGVTTLGPVMGPTGRYIIADRPMTEEEWIRERAATVIDVTPEE